MIFYTLEDYAEYYDNQGETGRTFHTSLFKMIRIKKLIYAQNFTEVSSHGQINVQL